MRKKIGMQKNKEHISWGGFLLLILTCIAPLGLLGTFLCTILPPSSFWISGILGPLFPLFAIVSFSIGIFYLFFGKKRCLLFFLSIILNISNFTHIVAINGISKNYKNIQSKKESYNNGIGIVSYNVCLFGYYSDSEKLAQNKKDKILSFLKNSKAEILGLQEFYESKSGSFEISSILKKEGYAYNTQPGENKKFYFGNIIFSKYPILNQGLIDSISPLNAIYADLLISPKDTLRVYVVHLSSLKFDNTDKNFYNSLINKPLNEDITYKEGAKRIFLKVGTAARVHESQVKAIRTHLLNSPYNSLLCGDLNENPISYSYAHLKRELDDAFIDKGSGFGQTYRGLFPSFRIDYILYHNKKDASFSLKTSYFKTAPLSYSDHRPIKAIFDLNRKD